MSLFPLLILGAVGWLLYTVYFKNLLKQGNAGKIKLALMAIGFIFLFMAVTGRAHAVFAILGAAMTQVMRVAPLLVRFAPSLKRYVGAGKANGTRNANVSKVTTATLVMTMDQVTGAIDGEVVAGALQGRTLNSLSISEFQQLYQYCKNCDVEAIRLLQTYISREKDDDWQQAAGYSGNENNDQQAGGRSVASTDMTLDEAIQVLGIDADFNREAVTAAHRSLMGQFHPDKGGNNYLASKLNTARDKLLSNLAKRK